MDGILVNVALTTATKNTINERKSQKNFEKVVDGTFDKMVYLLSRCFEATKQNDETFDL